MTATRHLRPTLGALLLLLPGPSHAVDGVLEINQTCALQTGCFAGDAPGFPVTISASGSYRLTGNLDVASTAADGIEVLATEVSLDLNGFRLRGPGSGTGSGVQGSSGLIVRHGFVRDFGAHGIVLSSGIVEGMVVSFNGGEGISAGGGKALVRGCHVTDNGGFGLDLDAFAGYGENLVADNASGAVSAGQAVASNACDDATCRPPRRRLYYLTQQDFDGSQALTACDPGFHMASFWEIRDTSSLDYDILHGSTLADSGTGPPWILGWIRTGATGFGYSAGLATCQTWTSGSSSDLGTVVVPGTLWQAWDSTDWSGVGVTSNALSHTLGWTADTRACDQRFRVWCIQD